jgi:anti-sigma regulatory factor (Ser/Thr protein kinase)
MASRSRSADRVELSVPSDPRYLGLLRSVVSRSAELVGFSEDEKQELELAVNEACANIIRHCYRMDPSQRIDVTIHALPDRVEVRLRDFGTYRAMADPPETDPEDLRPGGLGCRIMKLTADEVAYRPAGGSGTLLTLVKRRAARER